MEMAKSLNELRKKMKPEVQAAARAKAVGIVAEMSLAETRKSRGVNQTELASRLDIAQPNISQIESRPDALLSTLNQYIEALGGKLEIHAKFPDGQDVEITQFQKARTS
jgi:DNA-binding XRE family transcriptional regulator